MCGRFVGYRNNEELLDNFPIDKTACNSTANYNIAPSQEVLAIVRREQANWLDKFHWGLVPFWAKDVSIGNKLINARAETVDKKPSFRNAFKKQRCLIPADGFYEWQGAKGKKQPVYLTLPSQEPFAFAGLWETWMPKNSDGSIYKSCAIITTTASESVVPIHHRMPVILKPEKYNQWLDPELSDLDELKDIISNWIVTKLVGEAVSRQVNSAQNNDPSNIKPLTQMQIDF
jgi:putative SOS response-associated peptidase YedK